MQEERQPLPAAAAFGCDRVSWNLRLAKCLDEEAGFLDRQKIGFDWPMLAMEGHRQSVALHGVGVVERRKIVALDDERCIGGARLKTPGRVDRMDDRQAEPAAGFEDARDVSDADTPMR